MRNAQPEPRAPARPASPTTAPRPGGVFRWSWLIGPLALALIGCQRPSPHSPQQVVLPTAGATAPGSLLQLPPPSSDAGVLVRMLIAECKGPGYPDYDERQAVLAMQAMKSVVHNRLFSNPAHFGAPGARAYADIICAPGQWAGFSRGPQRQWLVGADILHRVDRIVEHANTGAPGRYHRFVRYALDVTYGSVADPFAQLRWSGGVAVRPGAYGWRSEGASHPGGSFVPIDRSQGGLLGGNQFYGWAWHR